MPPAAALNTLSALTRLCNLRLSCDGRGRRSAPGSFAGWTVPPDGLFSDLTNLRSMRFMVDCAIPELLTSALACLLAVTVLQCHVLVACEARLLPSLRVLCLSDPHPSYLRAALQALLPLDAKARTGSGSATTWRTLCSSSAPPHALRRSSGWCRPAGPCTGPARVPARPPRARAPRRHAAPP